MYRILLVSCIVFITTTLYSQSADKVPSTSFSKTNNTKINLKIYPNPATHFIKLKEITGVTSIIVYNLVGRKIKQFQTEKGKAYPITDLPKGMYLIQFLGLEGDVLITQRLSKR